MLGLIQTTGPGDPNLHVRAVKPWHANLAILRAAVALMFPPRRRRLIVSLKDYLQPAEFQIVAR